MWNENRGLTYLPSLPSSIKEGFILNYFIFKFFKIFFAMNVFLILLVPIGSLFANPIAEVDSPTSVSIGRSLVNLLTSLEGNDASDLIKSLPTLCSKGVSNTDLCIRIMDILYSSKKWIKPHCVVDETPTFEECVIKLGGEHLERWNDFKYRSQFVCLFINKQNQSFIDRLDYVLVNSPYYEQIKDAIENFFIRCATSQFIWIPQLDKEFNIGRSIVYLFLITVGALTACICSTSLLVFSLQLCLGEIFITVTLLFTNDIISDYVSTHLVCLIYRYIITIRYTLLHCTFRMDLASLKLWGRKRISAPRKRKAVDDIEPIEVSPAKPAPRRSSRLSRN